MQETRTHTIQRHVQQYLRETGTAMPTFAQNVVEQYCARVRGIHRTITFKTDGDIYDRMRLNAQTLDRMLNTGIIRLPADLEEAIVFALPDASMQLLRADLALRYGLRAVPVLDAEQPNCIAHIGALARESGEALAAISPMIEDNGSIGPEDAHMAAHAIQQLDELVNQASAMKLYIQVRTQIDGAPIAFAGRK